MKSNMAGSKSWFLKVFINRPDSAPKIFNACANFCALIFSWFFTSYKSVLMFYTPTEKIGRPRSLVWRLWTKVWKKFGGQVFNMKMENFFSTFLEKFQHFWHFLLNEKWKNGLPDEIRSKIGHFLLPALDNSW